MNLYFFDTEGRCLQHTACHEDQPEGMLALWARQCGAVRWAWCDTLIPLDSAYWNGEDVVERPANPARFDAAKNVLYKMPAPCRLMINSDPYDLSEEVAEITFDHPGTFVLKVSKWPYKDAVFTVTVPA